MSLQDQHGDVSPHPSQSNSQSFGSAHAPANVTVSTRRSARIKWMGVLCAACAITCFFIACAALLAMISGTNTAVTFDKSRSPAAVEPPSVSSTTLRKPLTLAFTGDVLMVDTPNPFECLHGRLQAADVAFCNLESPISGRGTPNPVKHRGGKLMPNEFLFRTSLRAAESLRNGGVDVVSLANNHMMDYGAVALRDTMDALDHQGIAYSGAGMTNSAARRCTVVRRRGVRVAFLSYVLADTLPDTQLSSAKEDALGVAMLPDKPTPQVISMIGNDIGAARKLGDLVVVSFHWGIERSIYPSPSQRWLARRAVDCGADIVVGHHPHCLQGVEIYKGKPILYSLGNLVFPAVSPLCRRTGIVWVRYLGDGSYKVTLQPLYIQAGRPAATNKVEMEATASHVCHCCQVIGTPVSMTVQDGQPSISLKVPATGNASARGFRESACLDFVNVREAISGVDIDLRYASKRNRFGAAFYGSDACILRRDTAFRLATVQRALAKQGLGLRIWDAYRPLSVQRRLWDLVRDSRYIADPSIGSSHSRGAAVDATLVDAKGCELPMPTGFDDFSRRAQSSCPGATPVRRHNAAMLRQAMHAGGFRSLSSEWWHFEDPDAHLYPLADLSLEQITSSWEPRPT